SMSIEFVVPFSALACYEKYDCTGQELINRSIVLINGERVALDLQRAEANCPVLVCNPGDGSASLPRGLSFGTEAADAEPDVVSLITALTCLANSRFAPPFLIAAQLQLQSMFSHKPCGRGPQELLPDYAALLYRRRIARRGPGGLSFRDAGRPGAGPGLYRSRTLAQAAGLWPRRTHEDRD